MKRLIYDGSVDKENNVEYCFISENLNDAADIFYKLYEEDIYDVFEEHMVYDSDILYGITVTLIMDKETKIVKSVLLSISIDTNDGLYESEISEIDLDTLNSTEIGSLLSKLPK